MTARVPLSKPDAVRERIEAEIRSGELARGERLPGEHALATRFRVSRATVRQALAELQRGGYIATQAGSGSFVTYDGRDLAPTAELVGRVRRARARRPPPGSCASRSSRTSRSWPRG